MRIKDMFKTKDVGGYLGAAVIVLGVVTMLVYRNYSVNNNLFNIRIMLSLVIGIVIEVICLIKQIHFLPLIAGACFDIALILFFKDSLATFVNHFNGVAMFGGTGRIDLIAAILIMMLIMILTEIVSCFMKRNKTIPAF